MNSNITLRIKDPSLNFEYLFKRSKEILAMAILIAILQFITYIAIVIVSIVYKWSDYIVEQSSHKEVRYGFSLDKVGEWTGRVVGFFVLIILIIIEYKYPGKYS